MKRKRTVLLVDGYNVLRNWPQFGREIERNFQGAREKLIDMMSRYAHHMDYRVIIVFDASLTQNRASSRQNRSGVEIIFTARGQTADAFIIDWINKHTEIRDIRLVTSDKELANAAADSGVQVIGTLDFQFAYSASAESVGATGYYGSPKRFTLADMLDEKSKEAIRKLSRRK